MRFEPDTLRDALLRPLAMAAPDAHVYVEIMAPDLRFLFALALLAALAATVLVRRRRGEQPSGVEQERRPARPALVLCAALALAFVPWLATSGNGRYFAAGLLLIGPVCAGLAWLLPATRGLRLTLVLGMVGVQGFVVQQAAPWRAWTLLPWQQAPYFQVDLPAEARTQPATIVTLSAISYSLLAPMFHPQSRWISLHNAPAPGTGSPDAMRTKAFLGQVPDGRVLLLVPVVPGTLTSRKLPNPEVSAAIGTQLAPYGLALAEPQACRFLHSPALAAMGLGEASAQQRAQSGFWLCRLVREPTGAPAGGEPERRYDPVFRLLEQACPRVFPAGGDGPSLILRDGEVRSYWRSEMKVYVYDTGDVYYKYFRALNLVPIGRVHDILAGRAKPECARIRGRSGLPWEREI